MTYRMRRTTAVQWERNRILSFLWLSSLAEDKEAYRVAGMISEADETVMREDMVDAAVPLNDCSGYRTPPTRKQHPKTRRMFESRLPSILACTIRICLFIKAIMPTYCKTC
jgi:hypothetical protein